MPLDRRLAWAMLALAGLHIGCLSGSSEVGHARLYWAAIIAGETSGFFALLCVALFAGLCLNWWSSRGNRASGAGASAGLAALATFLALAAAVTPDLVHGGTATLEGRTYHLAFHPMLDRDDRCYLYECGTLGLLCVTRRIAVRSMVDPKRTRLVVDERGNMVAIQVDDEIIASYSPRR
jgi:hypothetical protein